MWLVVAKSGATARPMNPSSPGCWVGSWPASTVVAVAGLKIFSRPSRSASRMRPSGAAAIRIPCVMFLSSSVTSNRSSPGGVCAPAGAAAISAAASASSVSLPSQHVSPFCVCAAETTERSLGWQLPRIA